MDIDTPNDVNDTTPLAETPVIGYDDGEIRISDETAYYDYDYDSEMMELVSASLSLEESIAPYVNFGVSVDRSTGLMMYEGHPVREIINDNPVTGLFWMTTLSLGANGFGGRIVSDAIDLKAVYENGVLIGLKKSTQEEYDIRTEERRQYQETSRDTNYANTDSEQYQIEIPWSEIPGETSWSDKYGEIKWLTYEEYIKVMELVGPSFYVDNGTIRPFEVSPEETDTMIEDFEFIRESLKNGTMKIILTMNSIIGSF